MAPSGAEARGSGRNRTYEALKEQILDMRLPPGADLDEAQLVKTLGVSRTPVREALARLASDGLVVQVPNRGAHVAPVDMASLQPYFEALDFLQRAVTRLAAVRRSDGDLAELRAAQAAFAEAAAGAAAGSTNAANRRFHGAVAEAAQNAYLAASYKRLLAEGARIAHLCFTAEAAGAAEHLAETNRQHEATIAAIAAGEAERAESLAHAHKELFRRRVVASLARDDGTLAGLDLARAP